MTKDNKILVVYFSYSGVTRSVAAKIAAQLEASTAEIKPLRNGMFSLFSQTLIGLPASIQ